MFGSISPQPDIMGNIINLCPTHFVQFFAPYFEFFINFDDLLRHRLMRLLRPTDQRKILTGGHPLMTVRVQSDPNQ